MSQKYQIYDITYDENGSEKKSLSFKKINKRIREEEWNMKSLKLFFWTGQLGFLLLIISPGVIFILPFTLLLYYIYDRGKKKSKSRYEFDSVVKKFIIMSGNYIFFTVLFYIGLIALNYYNII